ncbi:MAG: putative sulfur modification protein DndA [Bacteroidota bacterium]|jgi:cysteine desulfurase
MKANKLLIYLDNNATTEIDKRVLETMMPFLTVEFANANSMHQFGVHAYEAVKFARVQVSTYFSKKQFPIYLTFLCLLMVVRNSHL